jgi:hypothetical protein
MYGPQAQTVKPPEPPRDRCPVMVRNAEGTPTRCALSFGHAESHVPGEPVPA